MISNNKQKQMAVTDIMNQHINRSSKINVIDNWIISNYSVVRI